ncbi:MAG TPA: hypothetical protein IAC85_02925 [Candidatus Faecenecus gallistercoris]|uniref:Uncharacterized protein n=1 Tax=Candidatus Faecenecus gallistercoris TaxID=2840793 RepID=A0A9D1CKD3_9FIRM|nr:hypothetical protein [Bacillota bacterium]MDY4051282.1 hypothetical protein [Candidatus Faecenecus gallistercoris]CDE08144.1 putative uncharacterized protein [Bacillus sp. CAG:988]MDD7101900.1 hypothetical protein [Bacillota bacterium]PWL73566.1 MAG: hypothetical protein DBY23_00085 [Bacillota bacterium]
MSKTIKIKCNSCKYKVSLKEGITSLDTKDMLLNVDNELANAYNLLSKIKTKALKTKVVHMIHDGATLADTYGYQIMRCPECGELTSHFVFTLQTKEETFSPTYYCKTCKHKLNKISYTTALKGKCPKCHQKLVYVDTTYDD